MLASSSLTLTHELTNTAVPKFHIRILTADRNIVTFKVAAVEILKVTYLSNSPRNKFVVCVHKAELYIYTEFNNPIFNFIPFLCLCVIVK